MVSAVWVMTMLAADGCPADQQPGWDAASDHEKAEMLRQCRPLEHYLPSAEPDPVPTGFHEEKFRPGKERVIAGSATLAAGYFANLVLFAIQFRIGILGGPTDPLPIWAFAPIAGPISGAAQYFKPGNEVVGTLFLIDAAVQILGAALIGWFFGTPLEHQLVPDDG
jgi:hypothetical protein